MIIRIVQPFAARELDNNLIYVVVDTLRATTSLTTLKNSGAGIIYVVNSKDDAFTLHNFLSSKCLLIGEEEGIKIQGFDYGNTPSLFFSLNLKEKNVIFTSTSGAKTILLLRKKKIVYLASLINLNTIVDEILKVAIKRRVDIVVVPAGYYKNERVYVLEDWVTSFLLCKQLARNESFTIEDMSDFWLKTKKYVEESADIQSLIVNSRNGLRLRELGFQKDVLFSSSLNIVKCFVKVKECRKVKGKDVIVLE
ncbi:MAG: 2-phosphosulfolactate phosphatase [Candidatus Heimdallarchaeaceae archaeon]